MYEEYKHTSILTKQEFSELFTRYKQGDKAAEEEIIKHNLRLVLAMARQYTNKGMEYEDLVQEGIMGLMYALTKFDDTRGFMFSTYAVHWVKQYMTRALDYKSRDVRLPAHLSTKAYQIKTVYNNLTAECKEATAEIIADILGFDPKETRHIMILTADRLRLDDYSEDSDSSYVNMLQDDTDIEGMIERQDLSDKVNIMLDSYKDKRIAQIIRYRNGIGCKEPMMLKEIAAIYGISHERVRQLESKGMKGLKININRDKFGLKNYWGCENVQC